MARMYSKWRPDTGGYDYFESSERVGLGDDLPVPSLPMAGPIGVPSTDIGRAARGELTPKGNGPVAMGAVMPVSRDGLSGTFSVLSALPWWALGMLAAGTLGFIAYEFRRHP